MAYTIIYRNRNNRKKTMICTAGFLQETVDRLAIYGYRIESIALREE